MLFNFEINQVVKFMRKVHNKIDEDLKQVHLEKTLKKAEADADEEAFPHDFVNHEEVKFEVPGIPEDGPEKTDNPYNIRMDNE